MKNLIKNPLVILASGILLTFFACTKDFDLEDITTSEANVEDASEYIGKYNQPCYDLIKHSYVSESGTPISENEAKGTENSDLNSRISTLGQQDGLIVSKGYNPFNEMYLSSPFKSGSQSTSGTESSTEFSSVENTSEMTSAVKKSGSISLSGSANISGVRATFTGTYEQNISREINTNVGSFSMVGLIKVGTGKYIVENSLPNLKPDALPYVNNVSYEGRTFANLYGPYFISEEVTGGSLAVILKITYDSESMSYAEKQSFQAAASIKYFGNKATTEANIYVDDAMKKRVESANVTFKAYSNAPFEVPTGMLSSSSFNNESFVALQSSFSTYITNNSTKYVVSQKYSPYNTEIFVKGEPRDAYRKIQNNLERFHDKNQQRSFYLELLNGVPVNTATIDGKYLSQQKVILINSLNKKYSSSASVSAFNGWDNEQKKLIDLINALPYIRTFDILEAPRATGGGWGVEFYTRISAESIPNGVNKGKIKGYDPDLLLNSKFNFSSLNLKGFWEWNFGIRYFYDDDSYSNPPITKTFDDVTFSTRPAKLVCLLPNVTSSDWSTSLYYVRENRGINFINNFTIGSNLSGNYICDVIKP